MAKREYNGDPIDITDLNGEQHLSEITGKTIAGSSDDDLHDESTEAWPSALDRDDFTELQEQIIEKLCLTPDASNKSIAESLDVSSTSPYNVRHKLAAMNHHDDVPFEIPEEPTASVKAAKPYMDEETTNSDVSESDVDAEIKELYQDGVDASEIANRVGIPQQTVNGKLGSMASRGVFDDESDEGAETEQAELKSKCNGDKSEDDKHDTGQQNKTVMTVSVDPSQKKKIDAMKKSNSEIIRDMIEGRSQTTESGSSINDGSTVVFESHHIITLMENKHVSREIKEQIVISAL